MEGVNEEPKKGVERKSNDNPNSAYGKNGINEKAGTKKYEGATGRMCPCKRGDKEVTFFVIYKYIGKLYNQEIFQPVLMVDII